ncbi:hypothetical protein FLJC2902T_05060 [Flavobacterium limnosediminis JC2902]|uniref:Secretion system C-terminal sorting domain-containing protein n=1 Tax=Flavobacterium limnosediminis JC2902 TaxID=1341181 RepID=V6STP9_9FLAO|nr:T9SS type A sorting domain-containing protein [Flavobacterium limnosediminis]ESU30016.1 hypothetical protein FLJC2902T_05060 [Flavobacterium limnosediminis JC2902]
MKKLYFFFFLITLNFVSFSQNSASVAQTFGSFPGFNGSVSSVTLQPDGKMIVAGGFIAYKGITENRIIRLNADGSKDTSFNMGTGFNNSVYSITLQPDGKIIVGGDFTTYQGTAANRIIRLNADGSKDVSFIFGIGFNGPIYSTIAQPDAKIIVGGDFTSYQGVTQNRIIRLNADGSKDTSFDIGIGFSADVRSTSLQQDGKMLVGGDFTFYQGATENRIIRLNSDGTKDTSFNTGTGFNNPVYSTIMQPDGKIIAGGLFTTYQGASENKIIRLNSDGTRDPSFNTGTGFNNQVYAMIVQPDGKIIVGGDFTSYQDLTENRIIRLNSNGTKDTSFNTGSGFNGKVVSIAQQTEGKIIIGGWFTYYKGLSEHYFIYLNSDGTRDTSFHAGTGFNGQIYATTVQPDGKIIVGGDFTSYNGVPENRIIRLNSDGTKDTSFHTVTGFNNQVLSIALQSDGKIIVGGLFTSYDGVTENRIIRFNSDGTKDTSFNTGTGFNWPVYSIAMQSDGKIIIGGNFISYKGITENRIIRLNSDGTKDTSFNTGTGSNNDVHSILVQPDQKIIVGGNFTAFNGVSQNYIIRLNSDGTKDTSFDIGSGFNSSLYSLALQADGKLIVGGSFTGYNGVLYNHIVRLDSNGTKDTSFAVGSGGFNNDIHSISIQPNGKIIVGGWFTTYKGFSENFIIRLNPNGLKDTTFNAGSGFNGVVRSTTLQPDGKIIIGGNFTTYQGTISSSKLIVLNGDAVLSNQDFVNENHVSLWPNPTQNILNINNLNHVISTVSIYNLEGKLIHENTNAGTTIDVSNLASGLYLAVIKTEKGAFTKKFIKE